LQSDRSAATTETLATAGIPAIAGMSTTVGSQQQQGAERSREANYIRDAEETSTAIWRAVIAETLAIACRDFRTPTTACMAEPMESLNNSRDSSQSRNSRNTDKQKELKIQKGDSSTRDN
jgi:hypothetical protein